MKHKARGHEFSSKSLARLASEVLRQKTSSVAAKRLAGSVLTQSRNK